MANKKRLNAVVYVDNVAYGPDDDVPADVAKQIGDHAWTTDADDEETTSSVAYADWSKAKLKAEIKKRNADRAEAERIDDDGAEGDLALRLAADDVSNAGA